MKALRLTVIYLLIAVSILSVSAQNKTPKPSMQIAITFDDGPSSKYTTRILDKLEEYGAKATFFVIGQNIEGHEKIIKRANAMGCEIGNHTYSHKKMCNISEAEAKEEFERTDLAIQEILGTKPKLYRVPCGNCAHKAELPNPIILWSIDPEDWSYGINKSENTPDNRRKVIEEIVSKAQNGDIILMHDIYAFTADCCDVIIPKLCAKGFKLVTVSELMETENVSLLPGKVYHSAHEVFESIQKTDGSS